MDVVGLYSQQFGASIPEALVSPRFWSIVFAAMTSVQALATAAAGRLFGALGCFGTLRGAFRQTRVQPTAGRRGAAGRPTPSAVAAPPAPPAPSGMVLNGEPVPPTADDAGEPGDKK